MSNVKVSLWMVKWRLLGAPTDLPIDMLVTIPAVAFKHNKRYTSGTYYIARSKHRYNAGYHRAASASGIVLTDLQRARDYLRKVVYG